MSGIIRVQTVCKGYKQMTLVGKELINYHFLSSVGVFQSHFFEKGAQWLSGSVVECLTRDRRAAGSSLTGVTALWSLSKTHLS